MHRLKLENDVKIRSLDLVIFGSAFEVFLGELWCVVKLGYFCETRVIFETKVFF